jgi:quercetin dioxygenase-like cupin family protein
MTEIKMKKSILIPTMFIILAGVFIYTSNIFGSQHGPDYKAVTDSDLVWHDYEAPGFEPGVQFAVVHGDPSVPDEPYTIRASFSDGYIIPVHYHPTDENLTVLSGTFMLAMGEKWDASRLVAYRPGDFIYFPAEHLHYAKTRGPTVVQIHGIGPYDTILVDDEMAGH